MIKPVQHDFAWKKTTFQPGGDVIEQWHEKNITKKGKGRNFSHCKES